jgi:ABC-type transport system involved in cytochrome c biogenesis permease subunit
LDIALAADAIRDVMEKVKDKDSSQWTTQERAVVGILANLFHWSLVYKDLPLAIIPPAAESDPWLSPWDAIGRGFKADTTRNEMNDLRNMVVSYWNGEQIQFDVSARLYLHSIEPRLGEHPQKIIHRLDLELIYNQADLFLYAKIFYFFGFVFFLWSLVSARPIWYALGFGSTLAGFIPHLTALVLRIMILNRPPVSSLYETFIFVGFVVVLLGLLIERFNKNWLGIVTASVGGFVLLMIAAKYSAEGDTLKMLIAVLNSNFWLSTHVISITAGYGSTCAAGILGHVYLLQAVFKKEARVLDATHKTLIGILGLALTLTFLGTNLGGIWADQSWGRFWGWDPKENGALMIVLWTALLFHARIAKLIGPLGLAIGASLGMIVVMWAWFGVNLLSIGLHSYGFTSGVATALGIYVAAELVFLGVTMFLIRKR